MTKKQSKNEDLYSDDIVALRAEMKGMKEENKAQMDSVLNLVKELSTKLDTKENTVPDKANESDNLKEDEIKYYLSLAQESKVKWNQFITSSSLDILLKLALIYTTIDIPKMSYFTYESIKKGLIKKLSETSLEKDFIRIKEALNSLSIRKHSNEKKVKGKTIISPTAKARIELEDDLYDAEEKLRQRRLPMKTIGVRLNQDYIDRLEVLAIRVGSTKTELMREAIKRHLKDWEQSLSEQEHEEQMNEYIKRTGHM